MVYKKHILYTPILILPLKRDWIYQSPDTLKSLVTVNLDTELNEFIEMLKWKDKEQRFGILDVRSLSQ